MHHGRRPDPRIAEELGAAEELRAIGLTPGGVLDELDEGDLRFGVAYAQGKILINFVKPVVWLGMSPAEAKALARVLLKLANPITRG